MPFGVNREPVPPPQPISYEEFCASQLELEKSRMPEILLRTEPASGQSGKVLWYEGVARAG